MPIRQTLQWLLTLVAILVIVGGGVVIWVWGEGDRLLASELNAQLQRLAPNLPLMYQRASLESDGRVRLTHVVIASSKEGEPLIELPEVVIYPDRDLLVSHRAISVQRVVISRPRVTLEQWSDGTWNWEGLPIPQPAGVAWPEVEIQGAEAVLRTHRDSSIPIEFRLTNLNARIVPTARGRSEVVGQGQLEPIGPIEFQGSADINTGRWKITALARHIQAADHMVGVASELSGTVRDQLLRVTHTLRDQPSFQSAALDAGISGNSSDGQIRTADEVIGALAPVERDLAGAVPSELIPKIGLRADVVLECRLWSDGFESPYEYDVDAQIENGELTQLLPVPLFQVQGRIHATRSMIEIKNLRAMNADSQLRIDGVIPRGLNAASPRVDLTASHLPIDDRIRDLTPGTKKLFEYLSPTGKFDVDVTYDGAADRPVTLREFRVHDGSMLHKLFPYPVEGIEGTIKQAGDAFQIEMTGTGSGRPGRIMGTIRGMAADAEVDLRVVAQGIPIDETLAKAFETPRLTPIATTIRQMRIHGAGDVDMRFRKPAGLGQKFQVYLDGDIHNCEMSYLRFPMTLNKLVGHIHHNPEQAVWSFSGLKAERGETNVWGSGSYRTINNQGALQLDLHATDVPVDASLKAACLTASDSLQAVWDQLNPGAGILDLHEIGIRWSPGSVPQIQLPSIAVRGGVIRMEAFPYPWDRVVGALSWDGRRARIEQIEGWHGSTFVRIDGTGENSEPYFEVAPAAGIDWRLHLPNISVRRALVDDSLRNTLPNEIKDVVTQIDPRGPLDLGMALDLKQYRTPEPMLTAAWKLRADLSNNRFNAGVTVDKAFGTVEVTDGRWDGTSSTIAGRINLTSAETLELPISNVQGPFLVIGNQVAAGLPPDSMPAPPSRMPASTEELTGELYGGTFEVNAHVLVDPVQVDNTSYMASISLRDGELQQWAQHQGRREHLWGTVNGKLNISGQGASPQTIRGDGWAQVTQAHLYDLPVFMQIFSLPNLRSPTDKAFKYLYADIALHDGLFDFTNIEVIGDAISLVGKGFIGFGGPQERQLGFDFYTEARNRIPVIEPIVRQVASRWIRVRVDGTIDNNRALIEPRVPVLDAAFGAFMENPTARQARLQNQVPRSRPPGGPAGR